MKWDALLLSSLFIFLVSCNSSTNVTRGKSTNIVDENEVQVVLLYGQSNMEGNSWTQYLTTNGITPMDKVVEYTKTGYEDVQIAYELPLGGNNSDYQFVPVKCGQGYKTSRFGPEVGMAETIHNANLSQKVVFIKWCWGGSNLINDWRSPSKGSMGQKYSGAFDYTLMMLEELELEGYKPVVKGICWMQGEANACALGSASSYYENEKSFIEDLRDAYSDYAPINKDIAFLDAGISDCSSWTYQQIVNENKQKLADESEFNVYLNTQGAKLKYDQEPTNGVDYYHYDSASMIELGHLFGVVLVSAFLK